MAVAFTYHPIVIKWPVQFGGAQGSPNVLPLQMTPLNSVTPMPANNELDLFVSGPCQLDPAEFDAQGNWTACQTDGAINTLPGPYLDVAGGNDVMMNVPATQLAAAWHAAIPTVVVPTPSVTYPVNCQLGWVEADSPTAFYSNRNALPQSGFWEGDQAQCAVHAELGTQANCQNPDANGFCWQNLSDQQSATTPASPQDAQSVWNVCASGGSSSSPCLVSSPMQVPITFPEAVNHLRFCWTYQLNDTYFGDLPAYASVNDAYSGPQAKVTGCSDPLTVDVQPAALMQLDVLPYKILYMPPGDLSSSSYTLTQGTSTTTALTLGSSSSQSLASDVNGQVAASLAYGAFSVNEATRWDHNTSTTNTTSDSSTNSVQWVDQYTQTWSSPQKLSQLSEPGQQPWQFDEIALSIHPQFALWDFGGVVSYQMFGSLSNEYDVSAGALLTCSEGTTGLPIPGDYSPPVTLTPDECGSLLQLDPFAAASSQDASSQLATLSQGGLATRLESVARGEPGLGTNGTKTDSVSQQDINTQASTSATTADVKVTDMVGNSISAGLSFGGSGVSLNMGESLTSGLDLQVSYQKSVTAVQSSTSAASGTLGDDTNPIDTTEWLDDRWGTMMFQVAPPTVTGVTPSAGPIGGGTAVTISGTGFWSGPTAVNFCAQGGSLCLPATDVTLVTDQTITAKAPAMPAGTVDVVVESPGGQSATSAQDQFTFQPPPPQITGVSPSTGPVAGGTQVTITGSGFTGATEVWFGSGHSLADDQLTNGASKTCSGIPPYAAATFQVVSDTEITATTPEIYGPGTLEVEVLGPVGQSAVVPSDQFTYTGAAHGCHSGTGPGTSGLGWLWSTLPTLSGVTPDTGPATGGTRVTITGTNFQTTPEQRTGCVFGRCFTFEYQAPPPVDFCVSSTACAQASHVTFVSATTLEATVPPGAPGVVDVQVGGQFGFSQPATADRFTYVRTLVCNTCGAGQGASLTETVAAYPATLPADGTDVSTVTATVKDSVGEAVYGAPVTFSTTLGNLAVTQAVYTDTSGQAEATINSTTPGTATVTAQVYGAPGLTGPDTVQVDFVPLPVVSGISPATGPAAGGTVVTVTGSGLTGASTVQFGAHAGSDLQVLSDTSLTVTAPAGAGTVDVTVGNQAASSSATQADLFTYLPAAALVTRTLSPGWNTLSVPFTLADPTLAAILSDGGASLEVAYAFQDGAWVQVTQANEQTLLAEPLVGLYLDIGGSQPVTATLRATASPNPPPTAALAPGWNLVGPSALEGAESYSDFLAGVAPSSVPVLVDPNGAGATSSDPETDTQDQVRNGYAYWVWAQAPATVVGRIPTGQVQS